MDKIVIDGKEYDMDSLSEDAKAQLKSLQFVNSELARLQSQSAALQTARNAYSQALQQAIGTDTEGNTVIEP